MKTMDETVDMKLWMKGGLWVRFCMSLWMRLWKKGGLWLKLWMRLWNRLWMSLWT